MRGGVLVSGARGGCDCGGKRCSATAIAVQPCPAASSPPVGPQVAVIRLLVSSYFEIVRSNQADLVPKTLMRFLVHHSQKGMQKHLIAQLYRWAPGWVGGVGEGGGGGGLYHSQQGMQQHLSALGAQARLLWDGPAGPMSALLQHAETTDWSQQLHCAPLPACRDQHRWGATPLDEAIRVGATLTPPLPPPLPSLPAGTI